MERLALCLAELNQDLEGGLRLAQRATAEVPTMPQYRDTLGWVLFKLGRLEQAEATLVQASRGDGAIADTLVLEHLAAVMDAAC